MQHRNSDRRPAHEYDFEKLMGAIKVVDSTSPWLPRLEGWLNVIAMAVNSQQKPDLTPIDFRALTEVAEYVVKLVASIDRPQMLGSIYDYVRLTLDDEGIAQIIEQQANYDFSQIALLVDPNADGLIAELARYQAMVIAGSHMAPGDQFSAEFVGVMDHVGREYSHRIYYLSRIKGYFEKIQPQAALDNGPTVYLTHDGDNYADDNDVGGLSVVLIGL